jgi:hypothetical protein
MTADEKGKSVYFRNVLLICGHLRNLRIDFLFILAQPQALTHPAKPSATDFGSLGSTWASTLI